MILLCFIPPQNFKCVFLETVFRYDTHDFSTYTEPIYLNFLQTFLYRPIINMNLAHPPNFRFNHFLKIREIQKKL